MDEDDEAETEEVLYAPAPFSWRVVALDLASFAGAVALAAADLMEGLAVNFAHSHNLKVQQGFGEKFARDVLSELDGL